LPFSVSVALTGAFFGGVVAISYVYLNISRNKKELSLEGEISKDNITDKEIFKKIISYAIPFIIVDISSSLYNFIDMVLISKTMSYLKYDALSTEFITASVATWSAKINMIVNSIAMGLTVSLIPNIVEAFTLKDWKLVESRFNKALEVILISSIPMVIGISLLSEPIWNIFYGSENLVLGAKVLSVYIFISLFTNIFMVTSTTLQGLNKFKSVYLVTILGYIINAILDVPLMLLCNYLHLEPFIGALLSSMIGYTSASLVTILILRKDYKISYRKTINTLLHLILPVTSMIIVVILLKTIIPLDYSNRIYSILYVLLISLIGAITYLYLTYKDGVLLNVFGHRYIEKIMKKLTFKK
jgi:O-antigen/teichoic acid export membrane protein